jgi:outer membrane lipoprotein-sorting protein
VPDSPRAHILIALLVSLGLASLVESRAKAEDSAGPGATHTPTLEEVMQRLAESGGVEARFHESRRLTILSEPIESTGMLHFAPPDWLVRHVLEPGESKVVVRDDRVSFRDETGVQTLELRSSEVARAIVGNSMVLMRGDLEELNAQYEVVFRVEGDLWELDLVPRGQVVRRLIERLRVQGRGDKLVSIESRETSGDITLTTFSAVKVGVEFSPEARAEIFSIRSAP